MPGDAEIAKSHGPSLCGSREMTELFALHETDCYEMYSRYCNEQLVQMLRIIGFDVGFCRGEGPYLYDGKGARYLDLLSGFGVFAIGRNHPVVRAALRNVLDSDLPNLVQMDVPRLAGILAERLLNKVPHLDKVFFVNARPSRLIAALKTRALPRTIGDPQWVKMAQRTPAILHQLSCTVMGAWPINVPFFLRTIDRVMVAPSPM
jgi:hypothetical protein